VYFNVNLNSSKFNKMCICWCMNHMLEFFFIVAPCILISTYTLHSPTNALLLNLEEFKIYIKIQINYVVIGYVVVWQHVTQWRVCCVPCTAHNTHTPLKRHAATPPHNL
jgi:hypothetical protein